MRNNLHITYFGTFESKYPRNLLMIDKLQQEGATVSICHVPLLDHIEHKAIIMRNPIALLKLGCSFAGCYVRLIWKLLLHHRKADEIMVGYIGHLDMLVVWPFAKLLRQKLKFNGFISLYDTMVSDRGVFKEKSIPARFLWLLDWLSFRLADEVIMDTNAHKKFIADTFGVKESRIRVVPIDAEKQFQPLSVPRRPEDIDRFVVLFLGKFIPLQGIGKILHAMRIIQDQGNDRIVLRIAGDGQLFDEMHALAKELTLTNIEWEGWISYEEMPTVINQVDLCLGIFGNSDKAARVVPNKVWQCLRCGKTVITRKMTIPEKHPLFENVIFVDPTPEAISEAIQKVSREEVKESIPA